MTFMPYRLHGQYIIEGLTGSFFYMLGGEAASQPSRICAFHTHADTLMLWIWIWIWIWILPHLTPFPFCMQASVSSCLI